MKNKEATTSTIPVIIYCEELGNLDRLIQAHMPSEDIAKRTLGNQRT